MSAVAMAKWPVLASTAQRLVQRLWSKAMPPTAFTTPCSQMQGTRLPPPISHSRDMTNDRPMTPIV